VTSAPATALLNGLIAGLGVALPLGAISVLLLHEAFVHGWRPAAAGATGVALVDLVYAGSAVTAGAAITAALAGHEQAVRRVGAVILTVVAVHGVLGVRRPAALTVTATTTADDARAPLAVLTRFIGLTAVNPLTAVYFAVLATGLAVTGLRAGVAFVLGVFLGSWAWQLALVGAGALAGERLPAGARTAVSLLGYAIVLGYAVRLAVS
jgi:threonine/homoserine/homoserine lactone efflux protein